MKSGIYKKRKELIIFLGPALLLLAVYLYYPLFMNLVDSFRSITKLGTHGTVWNDPWYENYLKVLTDVHAWTAFKNTVYMVLVTIVFQVGTALMLALLVSYIKRGAKFFRIVFFFPIVISATALGLMFSLVFLYDKGMLNQLLELLGKQELTDWKSSDLALITMMIPVIWQYVGYYFVIILTGISSIPEEMYEVAKIDGAAKHQQIWYITLPLLRSILSICVLLAVTGAIKVFDLPWTMFPKGLPEKTTFLTGTYMYYQTMEVKNVDYGAALGILIVVFGVALSGILNFYFKRAGSGKEE